MTRSLVAFEAPSPVADTTYEEAWDEFVSFLAGHKLRLVADLAPVAVMALGGSMLEVYETVSL